MQFRKAAFLSTISILACGVAAQANAADQTMKLSRGKSRLVVPADVCLRTEPFTIFYTNERQGRVYRGVATFESGNGCTPMTGKFVESAAARSGRESATCTGSMQLTFNIVGVSAVWNVEGSDSTAPCDTAGKVSRAFDLLPKGDDPVHREIPTDVLEKATTLVTEDYVECLKVAKRNSVSQSLLFPFNSIPLDRAGGANAVVRDVNGTRYVRVSNNEGRPSCFVHVDDRLMKFE